MRLKLRKNSLRRATLVSALKNVWGYLGIQSRKAHRDVAIKVLTIYKKIHIRGRKVSMTWRQESQDLLCRMRR